MYFMDREGEFVKFFPQVCIVGGPALQRRSHHSILTQMSEAPEMAEYISQHIKKEMGLTSPGGILGLFWK